MGFQDTLADVCAPLSIKIDIDPARMVPGPPMPPQGGSIVDRDHKYCDDTDVMGKLLKELMSKCGMGKPMPCGPEPQDKPDSPSKPNFGDKPDTDDTEDDDNPFEKNRVKK